MISKLNEALAKNDSLEIKLDYARGKVNLPPFVSQSSVHAETISTLAQKFEWLEQEREYWETKVVENLREI